MAVENFAHVGVVAADGNKMVSFFTEHLGGVLEKQTDYPERKQISSIVRIGDCRLEIMEATAPDGVVGKFLAKKGPGLHHISLEVKNLKSFVSELEASGVEVIAKSLDNPTIHIAFVSPKASGGLLIEMYERL